MCTTLTICQVKRKRYTPAKSAEDEAGLVKFTTLLEATPRAKVAKLTENPVYNATNMTTIKNYLRMKVRTGEPVSWHFVPSPGCSMRMRSRMAWLLFVFDECYTNVCVEKKLLSFIL